MGALADAGFRRETRLLMIATVSIQDLKNSYEGLSKRVEQLGRFL
jgi:hypothetical protein